MKNRKFLWYNSVVAFALAGTAFCRDYFEFHGYLVYTAMSGAEALKEINSELDIILLDITMPDMDGLEVCRTIRDHVSCLTRNPGQVFDKERIYEVIWGYDGEGNSSIWEGTIWQSSTERMRQEKVRV